MTGLLNVIEDKLRYLSKSQRILAEYIVDNYDRAAFMTAIKLGETVGVSESTVVRFAYSLGYSGYPELQEAMQEMIKNRLTSIQRAHLASTIQPADMLKTVLYRDMNNLEETLDINETDTFIRVVDAVMNAQRIFVLGGRNSYPLAEYFGNYMRYIMDDVITVDTLRQDMIGSLITLNEGDTCFAIHFPRYSKRTMDAIRYAYEHGSRIILLTDSETAPAVPYADLVLYAECDMVSVADSLAAPASVLSAIIASVCNEKKDKMTERLQSLERIWSAEDVFVTEGSVE